MYNVISWMCRLSVSVRKINLSKLVFVVDINSDGGGGGGLPTNFTKNGPQ